MRCYLHNLNFIFNATSVGGIIFYNTCTLKIVDTAFVFMASFLASQSAQQPFKMASSAFGNMLQINQAA
jgi:hypothetical protein